MSKRVKISKLCIEIDGKKIELTMKQAKELSEVLNDTFGGPEIIFRDRWYNPYPYPYTSSPTITPPYKPIEIWCGTTGAIGAGNISSDTTITSSAEWRGMVDAGMITLTAQ